MNNEQSSMRPEAQTKKQGSAAVRESAGCCGGPAPEGANACCALDASVKSTGGAGCGCNTTAKKSCC